MKLLILTDMRWRLFVAVFLSVVQSQKNYRSYINEILQKMAYTPGSDIRLFPSRYLFQFRNRGTFSDITT